MDVKPIPGLEHLPYAEVWFHAIDEERWREASVAARALGKSGLEVWTTDRTPEVVAFLEPRGYEEARRYVITELDVAAAPDLGKPAFEVTTYADRSDLAEALYAIAAESYVDQPGRTDSVMADYESWLGWGLHEHPPEAYFVALEDGKPVGYGFLERKGEEWWNGFMAVARAARGRGVAGAIKRAQLEWAKANDIASLKTATEVRLVQMRALNERFGYRRLYDEIVMRGPAAQ